MKKQEYQIRLSQELEEKYGTLIKSNDLFLLLGFPSLAAFRKGIERKTVGVPIITFPKRRGKYALTKDVAEYLTNARFKSLEK